MVLKDLSKSSDVKVDISKLLEKGEEIRLKARDMMKRTRLLPAMASSGEADGHLFWLDVARDFIIVNNVLKVPAMVLWRLI